MFLHSSTASLSAFSPPPARFSAFVAVQNWLRFADSLMALLQPTACNPQPAFAPFGFVSSLVVEKMVYDLPFTAVD
jgi:hypothetical protein